MRKIVWILAVSIIAGCGVNKQEEVIIEEMIVEESAVESSNPELAEEVIPERPVHHPAETIKTDLIHTRLEVSFDWENSRLNGIAFITAKPHFYATDSLILDAKGMEINDVSIGSKKLRFTYKDDYLRINLGKTYKRDEKYTLMIDYVAKPDEYESEGSAAITDAKGLYFINPRGEDPNKMPQIWTQGETEASSVWFPTIDSPNAKTTQEVLITVDNKYATLSNGKLVKQDRRADGKRTDHWKQDLPHAPYLFMMAVGEFKVVKDSYTRPDGTKMSVDYYVEPEWESSAKDIFGETPEMISYFSELLGVEYPWDKYSQIVVRDYVSGAMENTGAVIFGDYVYKNKRELLDGNDQSTVAHELFHHWFGDLVTCESWSNLPLNESFANYSQYLWDEHRYGLDEADYNAEIEADGYYQTASMQGHHDLIWFDFDNKEQMFDGHSYNKGGRILHMLRNYLGDDAFFAGINNYLEKNKFKPAEFHQLRIAFEEVCGEDLNWFFNQWFLASHHPILEFSQEIDTVNNQLTVMIEQQQDFDLAPVYLLPMDIALFDDSGKHTHKIMLDKVEDSYTFDFTGKLKNVIYDDQQMLLAKKKEDKPREFYLHQYYNGKRFAARRDGLMQGSRGRSEEAQKLVLDALNDPFWRIRLLAISKISRLKGDNKEVGIKKLKALAMSDPNSAVRSTALNNLGKYLGDSEMTEVYEQKISDSSYTVVSTALKKLGTIDAEKAMNLAKELEKEQSSRMLAGVAQLYAERGGPEKYDFLVATLKGKTVQGFDKLGVLNSFTFYLTNQEPAVIDGAYDIYLDQAQSGGFYMKLFLPQNLRYLTNQLGAKVDGLNQELSAHEENNDAAYADQTRKKIKEYEALKEKYEKMIEEVEKDAGNYKLMMSGGEEE